MTPVDAPTVSTAPLTRPIVGIENRTAQEVFDIMCDRICGAPTSPGVAEAMREAAALKEAARLFLLKLAECEPHINDAFSFKALHGFNYTGPDYSKERDALTAAMKKVSPPTGVETAEGWHLPETVAEFHAMMRHEFARDLQANDLADETGYSRSTVSRWVNGHTAPHKVVWPAIAQWIINKRGLNYLLPVAPPVKEG